MTEVLTPVNPGDLPTNSGEFSDAVLPPIPKTVTLRHTDSDTGKIEEYGFYDAAPLVVEDGCLTGTLSGSFPSPYTGRVENYELLFDGLPIDGIGGGSGGESNVEIVKIAIGMPDPDDPSLPIVMSFPKANASGLRLFPVLGVDKTFAELEAAVLAGKTIIANCSSTETGKIGTRINATLFILQPDYDSTALYSLSGELSGFETGYTDSVLLNNLVLHWDGSGALPTISMKTVELQLHGGN